MTICTLLITLKYISHFIRITGHLFGFCNKNDSVRGLTPDSKAINKCVQVYRSKATRLKDHPLLYHVIYLTQLRFLAIEIFKKNDMSPLCMKDIFTQTAFNHALRDVNSLAQPKFKTIIYGHKTIKYQEVMDGKIFHKTTDPNRVLITFYKIYNNAYEKCCPLKRLINKRVIDKKWITSGLK